MPLNYKPSLRDAVVIFILISCAAILLVIGRQSGVFLLFTVFLVAALCSIFAFTVFVQFAHGAAEFSDTQRSRLQKVRKYVATYFILFFIFSAIPSFLYVSGFGVEFPKWVGSVGVIGGVAALIAAWVWLKLWLSEYRQASDQVRRSK